VQREFNRRMKLRFQDEDIEIASNNQTVFLQGPLSPAEIEAQPTQRRAAG
jgi:small-conductance mechanosensitive channel